MGVPMPSAGTEADFPDISFYTINRSVGAERLTEENVRLRIENSAFRAIISRMGRGRPVAPKQRTIDLSTSRFAAEMLALADETEANELATLFDDGVVEVADLIAHLGVERALKLTNLLGRAQAAVVVGDRLIATKLGRDLGRAIAEHIPLETGVSG